MSNRRQPVPARAEPTPAAIEAIERTPTEAERNAPGEGTSEGTSESSEANEQPNVIDGATEARALVAFGEIKVNDIVAGAPADIQALVLAGIVDPHPDAVAYARSLSK